MNILVHKKKRLADQHGVNVEKLQSLLNEGYTLVEIEDALNKSKQEVLSLDQALAQVSKQFLNLSTTAQSEIIDKTDEYAERMNPQFEADRKAHQQWLQTQIDAGLMSIPELPKIIVNPNPDAAPYSINSQNESISTLSGNLSVS